MVKVLYDYHAHDTDELNLVAGEILELVTKGNKNSRRTISFEPLNILKGAVTTLAIF